mgnify:CR=1 FL=1
MVLALHMISLELCFGLYFFFLLMHESVLPLIDIPHPTVGLTTPARILATKHVLLPDIYRWEPRSAPMDRTSPAPWAGFLVSL